jgi:hypothetical protein
MLGALRSRIAREVFPVLQDLMTFPVTHGDPGAARRRREERRVGMGEGAVAAHDGVHVVEEPVVLEVLVPKVPVGGMRFGRLRHVGGSYLCPAVRHRPRGLPARTAELRLILTDYSH